MNKEIDSQTPSSTTRALNNPQQDAVPSTQRTSRERVIQPSANVINEVGARKQHEKLQPYFTSTSSSAASASTVYPKATKSINEDSGIPHSTSGQPSIRDIKESNKPISLRVKSLLVVAILNILSATYTIVVSLVASAPRSYLIVVAAVSLIQLGMSFYLLIGKDHNTAALILKIYLVFQLIGLFLSLANALALIIHSVLVVFLFYVYVRVKSLAYY